MRLNPRLPLSDRFQSRIAAQAIVYHAFDLRAAISELRPDLKTWRAFGTRLLDTPEVRHEIEVILNRMETKRAKYLAQLEAWFEAPPGGKDVEENRRTAARLLGRLYINDKTKGDDKPTSAPIVFEGMNTSALTETPTHGRKPS